MKKELPLNTLENLSLPAINRLYELQTDHFYKAIADINIHPYPFEYMQHKGLFHNEFYEYMKLLFPPLSMMDRYKDLEGVPDHYNEYRYTLFVKDSKKHHEYLFKKVESPKSRYNYVRLYNWFLEHLCSTLMNRFELINTRLTHTEFAFVTDVKGFYLQPHTDIKQKVMTILVYMPDDDTDSSSGTNVLIPKVEKPSHRIGDYHLYDTAKFTANNTFAFKRAENSYHNVSLYNSEIPRKFLLFTAMSA